MVERAAVELCATDELNPYLVGGTNTLEERRKGAKTVTSEATEGCKGGADDMTEAKGGSTGSLLLYTICGLNLST
jgi:hypothetical protein